jgi:hypothetical protein
MAHLVIVGIDGASDTCFTQLNKLFRIVQVVLAFTHPVASRHPSEEGNLVSSAIPNS